MEADGEQQSPTLVDVLSGAADEAPDQVIVHVRGDGTERVVTYRQLRDEALHVAAGFQAAGCAPATPVILLADRSDDFQPMFWGAIVAGLVPVPLPPEPGRIRAVSELLGQPPIVVDSAVDTLLSKELPEGTHLSLDKLRLAHSSALIPHRPMPEDVALLQFSSGSTAAPKGVELTHANILANLSQACQAGAVVPGDVVVSWMPYFHDMGLIGAHLAPLAARLKQVKIGPLTFAKRPALWFEVAARHRATVLSAANFALALAVRRVPDATLAALDLSTVRLILVGAEPISPAVWRAFLDKTRLAGLDPGAPQPVYGLAEATVAVTFPPVGEVATPLSLDRTALAGGVAVDTVPGPDAVQLMDAGYPVVGCELRITGEDGTRLPEGRVGQIEVRGPNVARGYHRMPETTNESFVDGWLRTGDLGFLRSGRLCVTGRAKDVVFVNGRTFHAADLEQVVAGTPGLPAGLVAVVGCTDPATGTDRVAAFVQWTRGEPDQAVFDAVAARVTESLGHEDIRVVPLRAGGFPRTTSGKMRRGLLRERFEQGHFAGVEHRLRHRPGSASHAPPGEVERAIRAIWSRVLELDEETIGTQDRFLSIGGSSLKAMEVLAALEDTFGVTVPPAVLRRCATIAELTDHVLSARGTGTLRIGPSIRTTTRPAAAVIGLACRFPGAQTPEEFWQQLIAGHDSVTTTPSSRWAGADAGSFLDDPAGFDAVCFGIDPDEADYLDPHARIMLELAHEALERAGYAGPRRRGLRIGVFAAVGESGYAELLYRTADAGSVLPPAALVGNLRNLTASRVSQALDLTGPSLAVDTACSSALVALHLASRSLAAGECDIAVVGGVNLNLTPTGYRMLAGAQALSSTGRCHAFSAAADGFVPGEGGAAIVLAGLADARERGDSILAVVRGSAVNNDGSSLSLMAPNPLGQQEVIAQAYRGASVDPDDVSYVEAHGTGTGIGDPIEVRSLAHTFAPRADGQPRWLGSVKTNLGHLLNAAGMPSLVKVILALQHRQLPPSLHYAQPSSRFDLAGAGFAVVAVCRDWTASGKLVAGINGFGFGGTNAHVILEEEAPAVPVAVRAESTGSPNLLTLSAHSGPALRAAALALAAHVRANPDLAEGDICASASTARDDGRHRLAIVAAGDLADRLTETVGSEVRSRPRIVFLYADESGTELARQLAAWGIAPDAVAWRGAVTAETVTQWLADGYDTFIELGTGSDLIGLVRDAGGTRVLAALDDSLLATAGRLWEYGAPLDRTAMDAGRSRVPVPTYPFQRRRHWLPAASHDPRISTESAVIMGARHVSAPVHRLVWSDAPLVSGGTPATIVDVTGQRAAIATIRELLERVEHDRQPLLVVTEDAYATGVAPERYRPEQALLAGFVSALPEEVPGLAIRLVDLSTLDSADARAAALECELLEPPTAGPMRTVAWRAGRRLHRNPVAEQVPATSPLPPDGTYLITGGAGGLGAALAQDLAGRGSPTLILAGRSPVTPEALLQELRQRGATVDYRSCDVTDEAAVDRLIAAAPPLDAVFHAAGVVHPGSLRSKSDDEISLVLGAKVRGTPLLTRALYRYGHRPSHVVAFSSVVSVLPGLAGALGDYAAANAFLDTFAAAERAAGRPFQAVNLAAITDAGLASGLREAFAARGVPTLTMAQALRGLHAALALDEAQVLVAPIHTAPTRLSSDESLSGLIRRLVAEPLHRQPGDIGDHETFLSLGLDSLTAVDLVKRLEHELGRQLPTTLFFEYPTIGELASYLSPAKEPFPLIPVQQAFHTSGRLHPTVAAYGYVRQTLAGPVDELVLGQALGYLAQRHPMLRVRFETGPRQIITEPGDGSPPWFSVHDLVGTIAELEEDLCNRPQDLTRDPPLRAVLARDGGRAHLVLVAHHAAVDGYSLHLLCRELWSAYAALVEGHAPDLPPLVTDFRRYVTANESKMEGATEAYWRDKLASYPRSLRLPYDGDPHEPPSPPFTAHQVATDPVLSAALREYAGAHGVSLFHLLLAEYVRCLSGWAGQRSVAVNVARARRDSRLPGIEAIVAPLADTLPVAVDADPAEPIGLLAGRLRDAWLDSERHAGVSSVDLARMLPATGAAPRTVSPASFSFAHFPSARDPRSPVIEETAAGTASAATRLGLVSWEIGGRLCFSFNFPTRLFRRETVARLAREYLQCLEQVAAPSPNMVVRIREQCARTPNAIAVETADSRVSYSELDQASEALAGKLCARGVGRGHRIGLLTTPGPDAIVGVVGILKTGAAWVPLDADYPEARLLYQIGVAEVELVVCHTETRAAATALDGIELLDIDGPDEHHCAAADPATTAGDLAYVIFTSGSTGRPKGVPITHAAMTAYLDWAIATFGYGPDDRLVQTASICFDASVRQILAPLLVGATVVTVTRDHLRDPEMLLSYLERSRVTVWSSVPALWSRLLVAAEQRALPPDLSSLRWVHVGGDELPADHVRRWFDLFGPAHRVTNLYGPTETTINATYHVIDRRPGDDMIRVPIGRPVAGAVLEVVDADGNSCPPRTPGELLIGGIGLTAGYLGEPALTQAAFIDRGGSRFYRSGDRVWINAAGELEFLGRLDNQTKLRGYRVEPGEIEAVLLTHPDVERVEVLPRRQDGHITLTAFVELRDGSTSDRDELRTHVGQSLPEYMVPARFVLDASRQTPAGTSLPPSTDTERRVAAVWSKLLRVDEVARDDDFFVLGGDSILALEMFARLAEEVPALPRPTAIYEHRTVAQLAAVIDAAPSPSGPLPFTPTQHGTLPAEAITPTGTTPSPNAAAAPFPVTATQRGFLLAEAIAPEADPSWIASPRLRGPLDRDLFQRAVDVLVQRHAMMRVFFPAGARPPVQQELPATLRLPVEYEVLESGADLPGRIEAERRNRFRSWAWPLLRLRLLRLAADDHVLLVHGHHLIGDGYSAALLGQELVTVYHRLAQGEPPGLPPLRSTFRDYVELRVREVGPDRSDQPYEPPRLPHGTGFRTATFTVDSAASRALRQLAMAEKTTLYAPVLAAYHRSLRRLTGRADLMLGVAVNGRDYALPDIAKLFGPCVDAIAVRPSIVDAHDSRSALQPPVADTYDSSSDLQHSVADARDIRSDLRRIAAAVMAARTQPTDPNRLPRLPSGAPVTAQFFFTFLDFGDLGHPSTGDLTLDWDSSDSGLNPPTGTDVFLAARPTGDGLRITIRANAGAFTTAGIAGFAEGLREDLAAAAAPATMTRSTRLDAALVGYLPAPAHIAAMAGLAALDREALRAMLFPDTQPKLLEVTHTPLGSSGFVCLPRFADELGSGEALATEAAYAADLAGARGARCVSLAGMIPALTGYGFGVAKHAGRGTTVTTGHAVTAVSVAATVLAALTSTGRKWSDLTIAFVGLGSIGRCALQLLLDRAPVPPAGLILCDIPGRRPNLTELAEAVRPVPVEICEAEPSAPAAVYEAGLIVAATSSATAILDVDRLRPGTIVVDDSFPHCFDPARALARMHRTGDVLVTGGGLLDCGTTDRYPAEDLPALALAHYASRPHLPDSIAACQLESLVHTGTPDLPLVRGLVELSHAGAYWTALDAAKVRAAPLHLLHHAIDARVLARFTGQAVRFSP